MSSFYTHVYAGRGAIYYRGYSDKKRVKNKINDYKPSLFVPTNEPSDYRTIGGKSVQKMEFPSIDDAYSFMKSNESLEHEYICGCTRFQFTYLSDIFPDVIQFDSNLIRKATLDIEVDTSKGFSSPTNLFAPIITLTVKYRDTFYVFGLKPYRPKRPDVKYKAFPDEQSMLRTFIDFWRKIDIDVLFGWNTDGYDIPYIVNRIRRLFGPKSANDLSPWGYIRDTKINFRGVQKPTYELVGITSLDYLDLYRRYMPKAESEKLSSVAELELGETKVEYNGTLHELHTKDYEKFVEYNIQDVALVEKIDDKLHLSEMVFTTAYDAKCNFSDVLQQVRMWDAITFNALKRRKVVVPFIKENSKEDKFDGAYVLPAKVGKHKWVVSFDFASLYPSIIMEHNISPDTIVGYLGTYLDGVEPTFDEEGILDKTIDLSVLRERNLTSSGNGWVYRRDKKGFLGEILERMFHDRKRYKKAMQDAQVKLEKATTEEEKAKYKREVSKYHNFQLAKKIQLNAAFGALGNQYFRFFDLSLASSITISGRCVLLSVKNHITKRLEEDFRIAYDPILYGDTDSLYISARPFVETLPTGLSQGEIVDRVDKEYCDQKLKSYIEEALAEYRERFNTYSPKLEMVRDVIAEDSIFVSKKRYLMELLDCEGIRFSKPKRKTMGLEMVKSTTPRFCKAWLHKAVDCILSKSQSDLHLLVSELRKEFAKLPIETISYPQNVSDIEKYVTRTSVKSVLALGDTREGGTGLKKGAPIQVAAAFAYNRFLEKSSLTEKYDQIKSGTRMRYFYLKEENPFETHVMGMLDKVPGELQLHRWIDYERQFEKVFLDPLNILLDAVGWRLLGAAPSVMGIFD